MSSLKNKVDKIPSCVACLAIVIPKLNNISKPVSNSQLDSILRMDEGADKDCGRCANFIGQGFSELLGDYNKGVPYK